jgi:hypothetical protein
MELPEIVKLLSDNGIALICVGYLLYDHLHFGKIQEEALKEQSKALNEISDSLIKMNERINNLELCKVNKEK